MISSVSFPDSNPDVKQLRQKSLPLQSTNSTRPKGKNSKTRGQKLGDRPRAIGTTCFRRMRRTFASVLRVTQADAFTAKTKNGLRGPFYAMLKQGQTLSRADFKPGRLGTGRFRYPTGIGNPATSRPRCRQVCARKPCARSALNRGYKHSGIHSPWPQAISQSVRWPSPNCGRTPQGR